MSRQRNTMLEALLTEYGYSHQQLADEVNDISGLMFGKPASCTDRHVRRWIAGEVTWPWNKYLVPLKEIFGREPEAMGFIPRGASTRLPDPPPRPRPRSSTRTKEQPVHRRSIIAASAAATVAHALHIDDTPDRGRLGMSDVTRAEATIARLDAHFDAVGGGPLLTIATAYIDRLRQAIEGCTYGLRVEQALHRAVSALYCSAGWAARDCGQHGQAALLYAAALQSALLAADPHAQARAWSDLAMHARSEGRHRESVQITRAALADHPARRDPRVTALLYARLAIGQARTGDHTGHGRALLAAEHAWDRVNTDDTPPRWLAFLNPAELSGLAGIAHQALGRYAHAEQATVQALDLMPAPMRRNRAYYTAQLAELQLAQGRREEAAATAASVDTAAIDSRTIVDTLTAITTRGAHP